MPHIGNDLPHCCSAAIYPAEKENMVCKEDDMTHDYKTPTYAEIDAIMREAKRERARVVAGFFRALFHGSKRPAGVAHTA